MNLNIGSNNDINISCSFAVTDIDAAYNEVVRDVNIGKYLYYKLKFEINQILINDNNFDVGPRYAKAHLGILFATYKCICSRWWLSL